MRLNWTNTTDISTAQRAVAVTYQYALFVRARALIRNEIFEIDGRMDGCFAAAAIADNAAIYALVSGSSNASMIRWQQQELGTFFSVYAGDIGRFDRSSYLEYAGALRETSHNPNTVCESFFFSMQKLRAEISMSRSAKHAGSAALVPAPKIEPEHAAAKQ